MDLPAQFMKPAPNVLDPGDTFTESEGFPINPNIPTTSYLGELLFAPLAFVVSNPRTAVRVDIFGPAISFRSARPDTVGNQGWTVVEVVFIQLTTNSTPSGHFPTYSNISMPNATGALVDTEVGFDAAVCLQRYDPWIIEAYNSSTASSPAFALRIFDKGNNDTLLSPRLGSIRGPRFPNTRYLNTTGKDTVFSLAHQNGLDQMYSANNDQYNRSRIYAPSPIVGLVMPPVYSVSSDLGLPHRSFPSPMAPDPWDTLNSIQTGSPLSAHGSGRLTLYRTSRGQGSSSHNRTEMKRLHTQISGSGS